MAAAVLAGCGGSGDTDGDPGAAQSSADTPAPALAAPTKVTYAGELDALCASREGGGKEITVPIGKAGVDLNAALASGADTDAIMDRIGRLHGRLADRRDESLQLCERGVVNAGATRAA